MNDHGGTPYRVPGSSPAFYWLARTQMWLAAFAIIAMMLVTVADVLMRYLFNNPVRGTYDFTEVMLTVFTFHGMAACFLNRTNIVIDLIDSCISARWRQAFMRASDIISAALFALMLSAAWTPAVQALGNGETKLQLGLPISVLWGIALTGLAGTLVCALSIAFAANPKPMPTEANS